MSQTQIIPTVKPAIGVYIAKIYQEGTNAPTVTEMQNTTGITWTLSRQDPGKYRWQADKPLPYLKTTVAIGNGSGLNCNIGAYVDETNARLIVFSQSPPNTYADDVLFDAIITFMIFNNI